MKKISIFCAALVATAALSGCTETWDDNPTLKTHEGVVTANFLNQPVMQNMPFVITEANREGSFHLTCSQPDFGYAATAAYQVQVSLTEDFATMIELAQRYYDCSQINPLNADIASALETLSGVKTEADLPVAPTRVYMRLKAFVPQNEEGTTYLSNPVYFESVSCDYLAIWVAGIPVNIYLRGAMNGWGAEAGPDADTAGPWQFQTGPDENTWIIPEVTINQQTPNDDGVLVDTEFKVADAAWDALNLGWGDQGQVLEVGVPYALNPGDGDPGNLKINKDFTGMAHLRLDGTTYILTLETPAE